MFGLFKKKEAPKEPPSQQRDEWKEFAAPFLPEELSIVAVTDASGFGSVKEPEQELWRVGIGLTALDGGGQPGHPPGRGQPSLSGRRHPAELSPPAGPA